MTGEDVAAAGGAEVTALQAALAAENAAIYGCGIAGAHMSGGQLDAMTRAWDAHRARRDQLTAMLRDRNAVPVAALPAYRLPLQVNSAHDAVSLALLLEDRVTTVYLGLVALPDAQLREFGALAMQDSAVRAAAWRGRAVAFPGLPASAVTAPRARAAVETGTARLALGVRGSRPGNSTRSTVRTTVPVTGEERENEPAGRSGRIPGENKPPQGKNRGAGKPGKPA